MNKAKRNNIFLLMVAMAFLPAFASAQTTPANSVGGAAASVPQGFGGIFSCNQNGANAMSVGALGATGGVYVPVADATVELNTGTLVYKECILREVVDAQRQAATAGFAQQGTNSILTGRNGAAYFVQKQGAETTQVQSAAVQAAITNSLSSLDPAIQNQVKNAVAQAYANATNNAPSMLACPYAGAAASFTNSNAQFSWNNILAVASPCNPIIAYVSASDLVNGYAAQEVNCLQNEWQWGGGFYAVTTGSGGPCEQQIVTPSSNVNGSYATILNSGYTQLQNANDIGQMVGALFAGISNQILSSGGIAGINQPVGSSPSYLQQAVGQESQNLQSTIDNAALVNLQAALEVEQSYYNIMNSIASTLDGAITQLRGAENQCWQQVVQAVCSGPVSANGTCTEAQQCSTDSAGDQTCSSGSTLKVATSTEFSQPVINSQITSLASTTLNNLQVSQQALTLINQLIQNVSGTSADSQSLAIEQLNTLVANNELHSPSDLTTAQTQEQSVANAMTTLTQNTPSLWAGTDPNNTTNDNIPWGGSVGASISSPNDPGVGWCNFKNATTIQAWEKAWGG